MSGARTLRTSNAFFEKKLRLCSRREGNQTVL